MSSSVNVLLARAVLRTYPRVWRERYEGELADLFEDGATWRDLLDLARSDAETWIAELAAVRTRHAAATSLIVAYVVVQLAAFAALRVLFGPGRFDVAFVWAVEYAAGFMALCYLMARRQRSLRPEA